MKVPQFIKYLYFHYFVPVQKGKCLFIPHPGFCLNDKASIINYKADNCLIFVRYMLDNGLCGDRELVVVSTTPERAQEEQAFCKKHYPKANMRIVPNVSRLVKKESASSEVVISSTLHFLLPKKKDQHFICLSYYPISLKNDFEEYQIDYYANKQDVDIIVSSSQANSIADAAFSSVSLEKFKEIGKCRSDVLLKDEDLSFVKSYLKKLSGNHEFEKIALYAPTHRDYEQSTFDVKRSILGFDVNKGRLEKYLHENKLLIVCKLHPIQNKEIVNSELPKGVIAFDGADEFGLIELMKVSDFLITDYTSTYIDYLLLEKPVVFNFYDYDIYIKTRGVAMHPYRRICAGEEFVDEESFYIAINEALANPKKYLKEYHNLTEELNTFHSNVCEKTYKLIFKE